MKITKVKNITTEFDIFNSDSEEPISVIEFGDDLITFEIGAKSCAAGHLIDINSILFWNEKRFPFEISGKITELVDLPKRRSKVLVNFHRYNKELWESFLSMLRSQQERADRIFISIKGEEA